MDKKTILSLILVILILGSIVGMAIGTRPNNSIQNNIDDNNKTDVPLESYYSEAQTKILETYPEIIIASKTENYDKTTIEKDIINIKGIKRANVEFTKLQDESIIVIIRAISDEKEIENIMLEVEKLTYLTSKPIEFYKQGIVGISEKIIFKNYEDQNKIITYDFIDHRIDAIIGINTTKGDVVKGQLQANFRGDSIDKVIFYESENISNSPRLIIDNVKLKNPQIIEEYLYSAQGSIKDKRTIEEIYALLDINKGVFIENNNKIVYSNLSKEITVEDLNTELIINIEKEEEKTNFYVKENLSYEEYLEIINLLEKNEFLKENIIEDIVINYSITTDKKIENITEKLMSNKIELKNISQKAIFDFNSLTLQGEKLNYKEGKYDIWLDYPVDQNKEEYNFIAQAYATKKDILFLSLNKE